MGTPKDILMDRLRDVEEESERRRLSIENLLLQALARGKQIEELEEERDQLKEENGKLKKQIELQGIRLGQLYEERDELYDKYVNKDTLRFRNKGE